MKEHSKYIVWTDAEGKIRDGHVCFEEGTPHGDLNVWRFLYHILFEKGFLWKLSETIKYAIKHHNCYRGDCASDVIMFKHTAGYDKIWRK